MDFHKKPLKPKEDSDFTKAELTTELASVPVKQQDGEVPALANADDPEGNPIQGASVGDLGSSGEAEMDKILEVVNQKVKSTTLEDKPKRKWFAFFKRRVRPAPKEGPQPRKNRPVVAVSLAVLASLALSAAAYFAFWQNDTQKQADSSSLGSQDLTANSSVDAAAVERLSSEVQAEVDSLSDSQDFDPASLSDSSLGL
ncbi:hypothetical protein A3B63_01125 [Candidatus Saccharibacteria bacterium RIFCSPLOWO2_01_FULL_49_22]|nr:MAG: hypothetical protein A3B63_01125 [Candidatus Saccharibacteria bacterium RIFCSPLOWO2_01_FULL_49_22]